jgi:hypothetical protein
MNEILSTKLTDAQKPWILMLLNLGHGLDFSIDENDDTRRACKPSPTAPELHRRRN